MISSYENLLRILTNKKITIPNHGINSLCICATPNYIIQSIIGSSFYYGWGLGIYKYTGATYGILISLILTILMGKFCKYWAQNHNQGPLEPLW